MDYIERLNDMIKESSNIVFFGGAGVSTESGIKDFRSADGIYSMDYKFSPEEVLSHTFYEKHTEDFYDFYRKYLCFPNAEPNKAHYKLADLETDAMANEDTRNSNMLNNQHLKLL